MATDTDLRALCAELHAAFNTYAVDEAHHTLLERARAALAEGDGVGPSEKEQAMMDLDWIQDNQSTTAYDDRFDRIRRALEQLDD